MATRPYHDRITSSDQSCFKAFSAYSFSSMRDHTRGDKETCSGMWPRFSVFLSSRHPNHTLCGAVASFSAYSSLIYVSGNSFPGNTRIWPLFLLSDVLPAHASPAFQARFLCQSDFGITKPVIMADQEKCKTLVEEDLSSLHHWLWTIWDSI